VRDESEPSAARRGSRGLHVPAPRARAVTAAGTRASARADPGPDAHAPAPGADSFADSRAHSDAATFLDAGPDPVGTVPLAAPWRPP
jgi:hypothetical protein